MLISIAYIIVRLRATSLALHRAKETLEQRVDERTGALSRANGELAQKLTSDDEQKRNC